MVDRLFYYYSVVYCSTEGMKMRVNRANAGTPSPRPREDPSIEDDLKWVEENIPSSVVEA